MRISAGIVSYTISILHGLGSVSDDNVIDRLNIFYALDFCLFFLNSYLVTNNRIHMFLRYILHVSYVTLLASMVKRINRW